MKLGNPQALANFIQGRGARDKEKTSLPEVPGSVCSALVVVEVTGMLFFLKEPLRTWFSLLSHNQVNDDAP